MAKVIKIDETKALRRTHNDCGAVIEYFPNEVDSKVEDEPYGGGTDVYHYLTCPNCGRKMRWCGKV
jgi:hypothetical protein